MLKPVWGILPRATARRLNVEDVRVMLVLYEPNLLLAEKSSFVTLFPWCTTTLSSTRSALETFACMILRGSSSRISVQSGCDNSINEKYCLCQINRVLNSFEPVQLQVVRGVLNQSFWADSASYTHFLCITMSTSTGFINRDSYLCFVLCCNLTTVQNL